MLECIVKAVEGSFLGCRKFWAHHSLHMQGFEGRGSEFRACRCYAVQPAGNSLSGPPEMARF